MPQQHIQGVYKEAHEARNKEEKKHNKETNPDKEGSS